MSNTKLDPEFKAKWVAALRSGEYKQNTKAEMCDADKKTFCALGVAACVLYGKENVTNDQATYDSIPEPVKYGTEHGNTIVWLNDEEKTFSEIADYIETNL